MLFWTEVNGEIVDGSEAKVLEALELKNRTERKRAKRAMRNVEHLLDKFEGRRQEAETKLTVCGCARNGRGRMLVLDCGGFSNGFTIGVPLTARGRARVLWVED